MSESLRPKSIEEIEALWRERNVPERIEFHYIKGNYFRVICVDGGIGSVTPNGRLTFSLYSERKAIPKLTAFIRNDQGELGDEQVVEQRDGYVRELEVELNLSPDTALELADWLQKQAEIAKRGIELRAELQARLREQQETLEAHEAQRDSQKDLHE